MLDCLIMGDSIAVGVHQIKKECVAYAQLGINSRNFNKKFVNNQEKDYGSEVTVISLGSNDHRGIHTYDEIVRLREKVKSQRVYWILPNEQNFPVQFKEINMVAEKYGDFVIKPKFYAKDNVHLTAIGYKEIAKEIE